MSACTQRLVVPEHHARQIRDGLTIAHISKSIQSEPIHEILRLQLVLADVSDVSDDQGDALFEAGCDDGTIVSRDGTYSLTSRENPHLLEMRSTPRRRCSAGRVSAITLKCIAGLIGHPITMSHPHIEMTPGMCGGKPLIAAIGFAFRTLRCGLRKANRRMKSLQIFHSLAWRTCT